MSKISVVIPTCDRNEMLKASVSCVMEQSRPSDEIIVVNNGKVPLPSNHLPENIIIIELAPYIGVSHARNEGAAIASGEFIAFLDDDDLWENDYLKKIQEFIDEMDGVDCVITRMDKLFNGQIFPYKNAKAQLQLDILFERNPGIGGQTTVVKRSTLLAVNGYDTSLKTGEDKALVIDLILNGYKVVVASHIQAIQRSHDGPRLTDPEFMYKGISAFLNKYNSNMSFALRTNNKMKIYYYKYLYSKKISDRILYLWYYIIYNFFLNN